MKRRRGPLETSPSETASDALRLQDYALGTTISTYGTTGGSVLIYEGVEQDWEAATLAHYARAARNRARTFARSVRAQRSDRSPDRKRRPRSRPARRTQSRAGPDDPDPSDPADGRYLERVARESGFVRISELVEVELARLRAPSQGAA